MKTFKQFLESINLIKSPAGSNEINEAQVNDPHEIMTLAICMSGLKDCPIKKPNKYKLPDNQAIIDKYLEKLKSFCETNLTDVEPELIEPITNGGKRYEALAQAISAALIIFEYTKVKQFREGWLVGNNWPKELQKFRLDYDKEYNSSDIVLKDGNNYYGISLKRSNTLTRGPTVINYTFGSLLKNRPEFSEFSADVTEALDKAISNFFVDALSSKNIQKYVTKDEYKTVTPDNWKNVLKHLKTYKKSDRPTYDKIEKEINVFLKGKSSPLKVVDQTVLKYKESFIEVLKDIVFKGKLKEFEKLGFYFAMVIGRGRTSTSSFTVNRGQYHSLETTLTIIDKLVDRKQFDLARDNDKNFDFDNGAPRSNLTYYLLAGDTPILEIEIRYKGLKTYARPPEFQAYFTKEFSQLLDQSHPGELDDQLTEDSNINSVAIVPGSFKPPHKGHYEMVKQYAKENDKVVVIISDPKTQVRKTSTGKVISPSISQQIWETFLKAGHLDNVEVFISDNPSPVTAAFGYAMDEQLVPDRSEVTFGASKKDNDWKRWSRAKDYFRKNRPSIIIKDPEETAVNVVGDYSASTIRNNIENKDLITKFMPDELSSTDIIKIIKMLS